jgi:hypothetical protein
MIIDYYFVIQKTVLMILLFVFPSNDMEKMYVNAVSQLRRTDRLLLRNF